MKKYVVITGSVAAGASTLSKILAEEWNAEPFLESQIEVSNPFFKLAQSEPHRWSFTSQVHFIVASIERHRRLRARLSEPDGPSIVIEDRTPFEHTGAYVEALALEGAITLDEAALLRGLTQEIDASYVVPAVLVYREMTDAQLTERVVERNREGEEASFEHLKTIHTAFEKFISNWDASPVVIIPAGVNVKTAEGKATAIGLIGEKFNANSP